MTLDFGPALAEPFRGLDPIAVADLGVMMRGKVRDVIDLGDEVALIATDRLSAFDHVLGTVPYRGQVLNQLAAWWFERIGDLVSSHVVAIPDPNVTIGRKCKTLPVEVVVRGRLSGSTSTALWTKYAAGERTIYGLDFPDGMQKNDALPEAVITPTTKAEQGAHDEPITEREIVERGLVDAELWDDVRTTALAIFARGEELAAAAGLVLVDTKYEFGLDADGTLTIIDEVHTPDSSRFWRASTVESRRAAGEEPENLDKEYVRLAYTRNGYRGDGVPPPLTQELAIEAAGVYQETFTALTENAFEPGEYPAAPRVEAALRNR
jgi:phosphoribosylaminoimidazole-succinocarboxamide synthase